MSSSPEFLTKAGRTVYSAREHETFDIPVEKMLVDGELHLYPEIADQDFFQLRYRGQKLSLQPGPYVGLIPVNDKVVVDVQPRVPISNLARLLEVTGQSPTPLEQYLRGYEVQERPISSLVDFLANALVLAVEPIKVEGYHYAYQKRVEPTSFPSGRILVGRTLKRFAARGIKHKVVTARYERSSDTAPNRCLKYAIWFLGQRYIRMRQRAGVTRLLGRLNRAYNLFDGVELDLTKSFLEHPQVVDPDRLPSKYAHYKRALSVAVAIVEDRGIRLENTADDIRAATLLIKLDDIFEGYVRTVLQRELADLEPRISVLNGNGEGRKALFDDADHSFASPDIVVHDSKGETDVNYPILVEVKYKPMDGLPKRSDLNQVIAYGSSYRAPVAVVVQPKLDDSTQTLHRLGEIGSTTFYQYGLDLSAEDLSAEEDKLGDKVRELITSSDAH